MLLHSKAKKFYPIVVAAVIFLISVSAVAHNENAATTVTQIKKSIVAVGTTQARRSPQHILRATGFVVTDGKHVVTNAHVVAMRIDRSKREKWVIFVGNDSDLEVREVEIIKLLPEYDLALLKFDGEALTPVQIADSSGAREGGIYYFTGYPSGTAFGLYPATHHALLASISPLVIPVNNAKQLSTRAINQLRQPYDIFQLDATAYPGGSGSPLYDPNTGQIMGVINTTLVNFSKERVMRNPSGIVYAIPSEHIRRLLQ